VSRELRVGLIGCGIISDAHISAYARHAGRARISVCCDLDPAHAASAAAKVPGARVAGRLEEVLAADDVDAVEILTPHHLHSAAVLAAARAGKHILCQKPLARTVEECTAMITAAREAGVVLFHGEVNHTWPAATTARQAIADGRIGRLVALQATYANWQGGEYLATAWRYDPQVAGGGQLADGGIHYIDLLLNLGGPVEAVSCFATRFRPELGGEDTTVLNLRFAQGHLGSLASSHAVGMWAPVPMLIAFGTEGVLTLGMPFETVTLYRRDLPGHQQVLIQPTGDGYGGLFAVMIGKYLDCVLGGEPSASPPEAGRENLRVVLAAYESARTGCAVHLSGDRCR
jgi:predicted dehydrogenase